MSVNSASVQQESVTRLVARRGQLKGQLTRFKKFILDETNHNKDIEIISRIQKIENIFDEFNSVQNELEILDDSEKECAERDTFESDYYQYIAKAKQIVNNFYRLQNQATNQQQLGPSPISAQPNISRQSFDVKLPSLVLPEFNGSYDKWQTFFDLFSALIHNNPNLSNVQKYYYLQASLKGEAAHIIDSLELSDSNYTVAWGLLQDRYENKKIIIKNHIKQLFDLPNVSKDSFVSLRSFLDNFLKHFRSLKNLKEPVESWNSILIHLLLSKLDMNSKKEWEIKTMEDVSPEINTFISFLTERCQILESVDHKTIHQSHPAPSQRNLTNRIHANNNISIQKSTCIFCKATDHIIYYCKEFLKLSVSTRLYQIRKLKACTNCLRLGHVSNDCSYGPCRVCKNKHNSLLHLGKQGYTQQSPKSQSTTHSNFITSDNPDNNNLVKNSDVQDKGLNAQDNLSVVSCSQNIQSTNAHCTANTFIVLSTAIVEAYDSDNKPIVCRVLLDGGAQSNFITVDFSKKLNLPPIKMNVKVIGINGQPVDIHYMVKTKIKSLVSNEHFNLNFLVTNQITGNTPQFSFDCSKLNLPNNIKLADPTFNESGPVDILLGNGIFMHLLSTGQIKLGNKPYQEPILQNTKLGWVVAGPFQSILLSDQSFCNLSTTPSNNLEKQIENFWLLEECPNKLINYSIEESEVESHFQENFKRDNSGNFIVSLPFKNNFEQLGDSKQTAILRFQSLERKFLKCPELKEQYTKFMQEYIDMGHMSPVSDYKIFDSNPNYFLPHHAVIKDTSETTKLRVVFDASAKSTTNLSLNDVLKIGPCIQQSIFYILLRFRTHQIVFTADIAKMYRCIKVDSNELKFQQIFWRFSPTEPLLQYKLETLTYGTGPASFLATRCLKQLALDNNSNFPKASELIIDDFYMDDWLSGANDIPSALELINDVNNILSSANFNLRQWSSNDQSILDHFKNSEHSNVPFIIKANQNSKTLGTFWNSQSDSLGYMTRPSQHTIFTKRKILSIICQIFDPLGLIGPVITRAKIFIQKLWQLKLGWDDPIPQEFLVSWYQFCNNIHLLDSLEFPRHILIRDRIYTEIHVFCDASQIAFGSCIYFRSVDSSGQVLVRLGCSKSRVAPLKVVSLPRLELCGALLATQFANTVIEAVKVEIDQIYYWSDSTITLAWIRSDPSRYKVFVANRIAKIQNLSKSSQWQHVSSENNPADYISRGINPDEMKGLDMWFNGPDWLLKDKQFWPKFMPNISDEIPDQRPINNALIVQIPIKNELIYKYSSFNKLVHIVAYICRFKNNCLNSPNERICGNLSITEIEFATQKIVKVVQNEAFSSEIKDLRKSKFVSRRSKLVLLDPFLDEHGIVRVGGRLKNANVPFDFKHPIIIPTKHHFTTLLIRHEHLKNLHAGPQSLLSIIRQRYWPLGGRRVVRSLLKKCIVCFRVNPPITFQKMGDLPAPRVQVSHPFSVCGVDLGGPYLIKNSFLRNTKSIKAWLCVFICFSSKAMHLELVTELSTDSFLKAFKRFIARRGLCSEIFSDNATNFIGAENVINQLEEREFQTFLVENKIKWNFIPPRSPHVGGLWESAVRLTKYHLKRILQNTLFTYEDFNTILAQVESIINSRPLVPLTEHPEDLEVLTPGHFLIGRSLLALPENPVDDSRHTYVSKYRHMKLLLQQFWKKWSADYLTTLQQRTKWQRSSDLFKVGQLVLLREDNTPPLCWKIGRVCDVHPGQDGNIRVVTVKTCDSEFKRSITKISVLPTDNV